MQLGDLKSECEIGDLGVNGLYDMTYSEAMCLLTDQLPR